MLWILAATRLISSTAGHPFSQFNARDQPDQCMVALEGMTNSLNTFTADAPTTPNLRPRLALPEESQPEDFVCSINAKPRAMTFLTARALLGIADNLVILASQHFDGYVGPTGWDWSSEGTTTRVKILNSKAPGSAPLQVKHMMWSLSQVAKYWRAQNAYAEVSFTIGYHDQPSLGCGQLLYVPGPSPPGQADAGSSAANDFVKVHPKDVKKIADQPVYDPQDLYGLLISIINGIAGREDLRQNGLSSTSLYSQAGDVTFVIATSGRETENLSYRAFVIAMGDIANIMANTMPRDQWRQFSFLIREDNKIIGRGALLAGKINEADAPALLDKMDVKGVATTEVSR